jgi:radical SAM superfamily enzyme YgiQ (UPF0313 family)
MKILFVYPDINIDPHYPGTVYLGIGYLSSALKKAGHDTELLHIKRPISDDKFIDKIREKRPDLLAFTSTTNTALFIKQWAKAIKRLPHITTIYGGVHASLLPEDCIALDGIDMLCIGEGEDAIIDVSQKIANGDHDLSDIPNIWFKKNGNIHRNRPRPLLQDLDRLSFPDRDIYDYENTGEAKERTYRMLATRGCPYICTYCFNKAYKDIYKNTSSENSSYVRFRSPENVIEELELALKKYSNVIDRFHFIDDILPLKKDWFGELVKLYKKHIGVPYIAHARPNLIDEDTMRLLKESNCIQLQMGIESGDDYIRNSIMKRNITKKEIIEAFRLAKKYRIRAYSYNIFGLPHENKQRIMETVKLNGLVDVDANKATFFYPYPGTELMELCQREGLLEKDWNIDCYTDTILRFDRATREFAIFIRNLFIKLTKLYTRIYRLPPGLKDLAIRFTDSVLMNSFFYIGVNRLRSGYIRVRNKIRKILPKTPI